MTDRWTDGCPGKNNMSPDPEGGGDIMNTWTEKRAANVWRDNLKTVHPTTNDECIMLYLVNSDCLYNGQMLRQ